MTQSIIRKTFIIIESEFVIIAKEVFLPQYPFVIPAASATAKNKNPMMPPQRSNSH